MRNLLWNTRNALAAFASMICCMIPATAWSAAVLEEVIVTAQKREQSLQGHFDNSRELSRLG